MSSCLVMFDTVCTVYTTNETKIECLKLDTEECYLSCSM